MQFYLIGIFKGVLLALKFGFPTAMEELITAAQSIENFFQPHLTRGAGGYTWKLCSPAMLKQRGKWAEPIAPKEASTRVEGSCTKHRQEN